MYLLHKYTMLLIPSTPEPVVSYHPAARRWAQSCSWCSPRWSCQNRPSWRRTSCKGTRTPWQRWHSAWWPPPTRCWSAWHGRSWCGRCWSPGIGPAAGRESRSHGMRLQRYAWDARKVERDRGWGEKEKGGFEIIVTGFYQTIRVLCHTNPPCEIMWDPGLKINNLFKPQQHFHPFQVISNHQNIT